MLFLPRVHTAFRAPLLEGLPEWRWPVYEQAFLNGNHTDKHSPTLLTPEWADRVLQPLLPAAYIEWRYYSIIAPAFHGIVGLSLFNPFRRFDRIAEGGLLLIIAGVFAAPRQPDALRDAIARDELLQLCWMHLFPTASLRFARDGSRTLQAEHNGLQLCVKPLSEQQQRVTLRSQQGIELVLHHDGLEGTSIAPCFADDLQQVPGVHWVVHNPSPIARTTGELHLSQTFLQTIGQQQMGAHPNMASAALRNAAAAGSYQARWEHANGYYEHSFGINPMPLHGWDFLFVPDAERRQGLVLQTYVGSKIMRYLEVLWEEAGTQRYTRFTDDHISLAWGDVYVDQQIQVMLPARRTIVARKPGLRLEVDNHLPHHIPFLRPEKLVVRHFFISEQIGFTNWKLTDDDGRVLAEAHEQPSGGEVAHVR